MNAAAQRVEADLEVRFSPPGPVVARGAMDISMVMDPDVLDTRHAKKEWDMAEPAASAAASGTSIALGLGLAGLGSAVVGAAVVLATLVVLCMTRPRTTHEWVTGIVSTAVSSLCGGAYVVLKLGLHRDLPADPTALWLTLVFLGGVIFACGLPGWFIVRCTFNYFDAKKDATIVDVVRDVKSVSPL